MEKMPSSQSESSNTSDNQFRNREDDVFDITDLGGEIATDAKILKDRTKQEQARKQEQKKNNLELDTRDKIQEELKQWEELRKMAELRIEASGVVKEVADETLSKQRLSELAEPAKDTVQRLRRRIGIKTDTQLGPDAAAEERMWRMKRAEADRRAEKTDMKQSSVKENEEPIIELTDDDIEVVEEQKPEVINIRKNKKSPPPPPAIRRAA